MEKKSDYYIIDRIRPEREVLAKLWRKSIVCIFPEEPGELTGINNDDYFYSSSNHLLNPLELMQVLCPKLYRTQIHFCMSQPVRILNLVF